MNGSMSNGVEDSTHYEDATVDHALLEALFANEMMHIDSSSPLSPNFLSQHLSEAMAATPNRSQINSVDATTIAEKALLRDFGVTSSPVIHATAPAEEPPPFSESTLAQSTPWRSESQVASAVTNNIHVPSHPQTHHTTLNYAEIAPAQPIHATMEPELSSQQVPTLHVPSIVAPPIAATSVSSGSFAPNGGRAPVPAPSSQQINQVPQERLNQLVSQFTTLASRLGIELPSNVLQSLTSAAAACGSMAHSLNPAVTKSDAVDMQVPGLKSASSETSMESHPSPTQPATAVSAATASGLMTNVVQELRKTAEEAIAAVSETRKRVLDEKPPSSPPSGATAPSDPSASNATGGRPMYSKRRKKPRLSDCETRLSELQAENDLLKRHLENVSNKSYRFELEKVEAGERFKKMLDGETSQEQMEKSVHEFTDLYSDYGRRRQQELSFHLDQLKRLVNPTNFTKMGLWTIAQNSTDKKGNTIAGILMKELDITPQQGRKILDQREKIRALCDNLKECLALIVKLKTLCEQKTRLFHDRMTKCREILTPKQTVKLIIWINDNTQLLEAVCPGWGTEHIQSKAPL